ncbi:hypothetical protein LMG6001_05831 [Achromobacter insolitus]|nr:hypothetical protein LMG6001_05831 [Achromobacter insolitus]
MVAVDQRRHPQVQVGTRGDDRPAAASPIRAVDQRACLERHGIAVDAAGIVDVACGDAGRAAVDEAGVGQALRHRDGVHARGQQGARGLVVQRIRRNAQVAPGTDAGAVIQGPADHEAQVAATGDIPVLVQGPRVLQPQVARGLQRSDSLQRLHDDSQGPVRVQLAAGVPERVGDDARIALGGDLAAGVVQVGGGQVQGFNGPDIPRPVVDAVRHEGDHLAEHACRRLGGVRDAAVAKTDGAWAAVIEAGRVQGQCVVGLDQAAAVVQRAGGGDGKVMGGERALAVDETRRLDARIAGGGDRSAGGVQLVIDLDRGAGRCGQLAALVEKIGGGDIQGAALNDRITGVHAARRRQGDLPYRGQLAVRQIQSTRGQAQIRAGEAGAAMNNGVRSQRDAARLVERAIGAHPGHETARVGK